MESKKFISQDNIKANHDYTTQNKIVNLISNQNLLIEKQLAKCMKEIQTLMALKNPKLKRLNSRWREIEKQGKTMKTYT